MSGDLEDFLRRAAQRRQAKAGGENVPAAGPGQPPLRPQPQRPQVQQPQGQRPQPQRPQVQQPQAPQRQKPQYTNRRTERVARPVEEEILVAEVVEDVDSQWNNRRRKIEEAKQAAKQAEKEAADAFAKVQSQAAAQKKPASQHDTAKVTGLNVEDLIQLLRRPGGMQQAILLREILDRPEHRW